MLSGSISEKSLIEGYGVWVERYLQQGWDGYFFTFMFNHVPGSVDFSDFGKCIGT